MTDTTKRGDWPFVDRMLYGKLDKLVKEQKGLTLDFDPKGVVSIEDGFGSVFTAFFMDESERFSALRLAYNWVLHHFKKPVSNLDKLKELAEIEEQEEDAVTDTPLQELVKYAHELCIGMEYKYDQLTGLHFIKFKDGAYVNSINLESAVKDARQYLGAMKTLVDAGRYALPEEKPVKCDWCHAVIPLAARMGNSKAPGKVFDSVYCQNKWLAAQHMVDAFRADKTNVSTGKPIVVTNEVKALEETPTTLDTKSPEQYHSELAPAYTAEAQEQMDEILVESNKHATVDNAMWDCTDGVKDCMVPRVDVVEIPMTTITGKDARTQQLKEAFEQGNVEMAKGGFGGIPSYGMTVGGSYDCKKCGRHHPAGPCENFKGSPIWRVETKDIPVETGKVRVFDTGATRDTDEGKPDYDGFLSFPVLEAFGRYMNHHRVQSDGTLRDSDNWQKGISKTQYMKSAMRHFLDWWALHRGYERLDQKDGHAITIEEAICGVLFNAQGYLHEHLKEKNDE